MVIETKYDIGQEVWFNYDVNGTVVSGKISSAIYAGEFEEIWYSIKGSPMSGMFESELYPSREAAEEQKQ